MNFRMFLLAWIPVPFLLGLALVFFLTKSYALGACAVLALALYGVFLFGDVIAIRLAITRMASKMAAALVSGAQSFSHMASRAQPHVLHGTHVAAQKVGHAGAGIAKGGAELTGFAWTKYKDKPWLWTGVLLVLFAIWVFLDAYSEKDSFLFHKSCALLLIATGFFLSHFEQWDTIAQAVFRNLLRSWAIASAIVLVIAGGHIYIEVGMMTKHQTNLSVLQALVKSWQGDTGWWYMTVVSILSLAVSIVILNGWQGAVARWVGDVFAFIGGFFINKHGPLITTVSWGVLMAILTLGAFGKNQESGGDWAGELYVLYSAFIFVILIGLGVVIVGRSKK